MLFFLFMWDRIREKLQILADAAKYDVSCASSGSKRDNSTKGIGSTQQAGICHSYTEDGRCVSLLKILLTNHCIFDCAYCVSRRSNDIKRAAFTVEEVVELTINFYRRNYIEGLFLSSGIFKDPDHTMERLVRIAKKLRTEKNFNGYIHLKTIPGASDDLIREAALYADRLSVNIELPTELSLQQLAPEKSFKNILLPMEFLSKAIIGYGEQKKIIKRTPVFAPAGQSTQMVIGASPETDHQIMQTADTLYKKYNLRRVYYSGYVPVSADNRLPVLGSAVPFLRENRLYQADWLLRFYKFDLTELLNESSPALDLEVDPKLSWALRNPQFFPVNINTASYRDILRVPGIGIKSAKKITEARRFGKLTEENLRSIGVVLSRAKYFIICQNSRFTEIKGDIVKRQILQNTKSNIAGNGDLQLSLF